MEVLLLLHHIKTKSGHVHNKQKVEVFMTHTTITKAEVLLPLHHSKTKSVSVRKGVHNDIKKWRSS